MEEMEVPQVVFCTKLPFKNDVLSRMGLTEDFLSPMWKTYMEDLDIADLNQVWENATYSMNELSIKWMLMHGIGN